MKIRPAPIYEVAVFEQFAKEMFWICTEPIFATDDEAVIFKNIGELDDEQSVILREEREILENVSFPDIIEPSASGIE